MDKGLSTIMRIPIVHK